MLRFPRNLKGIYAWSSEKNIAENAISLILQL